MGNERDLRFLSVRKPVEEAAYDLNAAAFSEATSIVVDYILDSIELNFSSAEAKTITVTSAAGTILWGGAVDTSSANLGYATTGKHFNLIFDQAFKSGDDITVAVTQLAGAGTMGCIVKVR